jgi:hypothetical protein
VTYLDELDEEVLAPRLAVLRIEVRHPQEYHDDDVVADVIAEQVKCMSNVHTIEPDRAADLNRLGFLSDENGIAYSMLGLFNIMMILQYGEGQRAFMRLQHELQSMHPDESLFAWKMPNSSAGEQYDLEASPDKTSAPDE